MENDDVTLTALLEGETNPRRREAIMRAYHKFSGGDPAGFNAQFAILGAACAGRIERAAASAALFAEELKNGNVDSAKIADAVFKKLPNYGEMQKVTETMKAYLLQIDGKRVGDAQTKKGVEPLKYFVYGLGAGVIITIIPLILWIFKQAN